MTIEYMLQQFHLIAMVLKKGIDDFPHTWLGFDSSIIGKQQPIRATFKLVTQVSDVTVVETL